MARVLYLLWRAGQFLPQILHTKSPTAPIWNNLNEIESQRGLTEEMPENVHVCIQKAATHSHVIQSTPF